MNGIWIVKRKNKDCLPFFPDHEHSTCMDALEWIEGIPQIRKKKKGLHPTADSVLFRGVPELVIQEGRPPTTSTPSSWVPWNGLRRYTRRKEGKVKR
jgi:hypothetical protein